MYDKLYKVYDEVYTVYDKVYKVYGKVYQVYGKVSIVYGLRYPTSVIYYPIYIYPIYTPYIPHIFTFILYNNYDTTYPSLQTHI